MASLRKIDHKSDPAVLPCEDPAAHDALVADYYARFAPTLPEERLYVDEAIRCDWLLLRLRRTETELNLFVHETGFRPDPDRLLGQTAAINPKVFSGLQWRINSVRKAKTEALAGLRDLREHPIPDSAPMPPKLASISVPAPRPGVPHAN
jgi:hypothetical protein